MAFQDIEPVSTMQTVPKVYYKDDSPLPTNWIAEGSDGNYYVVPAEPGGWLHRDKYEPQDETLNPVSPQKARTITWYVYGDVGHITIAGT
ncbi:MAG: hypothetical protein ACJ78Q_16860 [Chloroflexia bacterium]